MYSMKWFLCTLVIACISVRQVIAAPAAQDESPPMPAIELIPDRAEVIHVNSKYLRHLNITLTKPNNKRNLCYLDMDIDTYYEAGNNYSFTLRIYEYLSGRYHPLPIKLEFKMCDFYNNDPLIGKMMSKQFSSNLTCPFSGYEFKYDVEDQEKALFFGANESGDAQGKVIGGYKVLLPDGRLMSVEYTVEGESGFVPKISFEENANPFGKGK